MFLRALGFGPKPLAAEVREKLPQPGAFVDVVVAGGRGKSSVAFEELGQKTFVVRAMPGLRAGHNAVFSYFNDNGKFRFSARCIAVGGGQATFALPERIETLESFTGAQQRGAVRLDATIPVHWRHAPAGKGEGDFTRGSITDISRTGASLIVDRELRRGAYVEVKMQLTSSAAPLVLLGEVMRVAKIETSGKVSLGLRFNGVTPDEDRAIMEFINKRQAERRSRGLA
jgi:hypothetical protein